MILFAIPDFQDGVEPHNVFWAESREQVEELYKEYEAYAMDPNKDTWYGFGGWLRWQRKLEPADLDLFYDHDDEYGNYSEGEWYSEG